VTDDRSDRPAIPAADDYAWPDSLVAASDAYEPARRRPRPAFLRAVGWAVLIYFVTGLVLGFLPLGELAGPILLVIFAFGIYWSGRRYAMTGVAQWAIVVSGSVVASLVLAYGLLALMLAIVEHSR
jgi:hypothetical protein